MWNYFTALKPIHNSDQQEIDSYKNDVASHFLFIRTLYFLRVGSFHLEDFYTTFRLLNLILLRRVFYLITQRRGGWPSRQQEDQVEDEEEVDRHLSMWPTSWET